MFNDKRGRKSKRPMGTCEALGCEDRAVVPAFGRNFCWSHMLDAAEIYDQEGKTGVIRLLIGDAAYQALLSGNRTGRMPLVTDDYPQEAHGTTTAIPLDKPTVIEHDLYDYPEEDHSVLEDDECEEDDLTWD